MKSKKPLPQPLTEAELDQLYMDHLEALGDIGLRYQEARRNRNNIFARVLWEEFCLFRAEYRQAVEQQSELRRLHALAAQAKPAPERTVKR